MRLIDADALIAKLKMQYGEDLGWQCTVNMSDVGMMVEDAPTVDAVEVVHGQWKEYGLRNPQCSICSKFNYETSRYCPHCGAKMEFEQGEGNNGNTK